MLTCHNCGKTEDDGAEFRVKDLPVRKQVRLCLECECTLIRPAPCTLCKKSKTYAEFTTDRKMNHGTKSNCKACMSFSQVLRYAQRDCKQLDHVLKDGDYLFKTDKPDRLTSLILSGKIGRKPPRGRTLTEYQVMIARGHYQRATELRRQLAEIPTLVEMAAEFGVQVCSLKKAVTGQTHKDVGVTYAYKNDRRKSKYTHQFTPEQQAKVNKAREKKRKKIDQLASSVEIIPARRISDASLGSKRRPVSQDGRFDVETARQQIRKVLDPRGHNSGAEASSSG